MTDNFKTRKKRVAYTKQFKRIALIEYSKGKKPNEIFKSLGVELVSNDKKYASKLLHKWKVEFYKNLSLYSMSDGFDNKLLIYELNNILSVNPKNLKNTDI